MTKIVTTDAIYKDMGITSISIKKSKEIGYAREVVVTAQKVRITRKKTVTIPDYILKAGSTMADAGKASTSNISDKPTGSSVGSVGSGSEESQNGSGSGGGATGSASGISGCSDAKKKHSILYGVASGSGLI